MQAAADIRSWSRGMTLRERLLTIGESISPPLAMQYIIEGKGFLDPLVIQQKLELLANIIPALKLMLEGKQWTQNGQVPQLIVHDAPLPSDWNDEIFTTPLYSRAGMCFAFHLFQSDHPTLLIRVLHCAMDGIGALKLIEHFFRLLRNEQVPSIKDHPKDHDVRRAIGRTPATIRSGYASNWKGLAHGTTRTGSVQFKMEVLEYPERIDGITGSVTKWYMEQTQEPARFMIPVNIRRHGIYAEALSNLSLPIYLKTVPEQSTKDIQAQLLKELAACNELAYEPTETLASLIPSGILGNIFFRMIQKAQLTNRYPMSGFISDLGKVDLDSFSTTGFEATNFFSLPVFVPLAPFCLISCYHQKGTRIAFSVPDYYDSDLLRRSLQNALKPVRPTEECTTTPEADKGELAKALRIIWSEILKIPGAEIGLNDRFSDLGGESINLLFLVHSVSRKYVPNKQGVFMNDVLRLAGSISIQSMMNIISSYNMKP